MIDIVCTYVCEACVLSYACSVHYVNACFVCACDASNARSVAVCVTCKGGEWVW